MVDSPIAEASVRNQDLVNARRRAIVDAAVKVLSQKGFAAAKTQEIADLAKVTQGTLYNYISSKEDILYLICDEIATARMRALRTSLANASEPYDRLVAVLQSMIETYFEFPEHAAVAFRETQLLAKPARDKIRKRFAEHIGSVQRVLEDAARAGVCKVPDARFTANMLTFLPSVLALRSWYSDHLKHREATTEYMLQFILDGLNVRRRKAKKLSPGR
jgi:AcrR family transcriptional regulator